MRSSMYILSATNSISPYSCRYTEIPGQANGLRSVLLNVVFGSRPNLCRPLPRFVGGTFARLASGVSVPLGRGAVAPALALLLTVALASLAHASHAAPTGVTVTPGASALTVTWTASSGADGYRVQWKSGSQDWDPTTRESSVSGGSTVTDTISSLTAATVYTVRVGATKGTENPAWSDTATGAPLFGCANSPAVGNAQVVSGANNDLIDDCENLLAAKAVLDPGGTELKWATDKSISSWSGVSTGNFDGVKRVWSVVESGPSGERDCASGATTRLRTRVPAAFSDLTALETLKLRNHELSGTIPAQLGDLSKLKHLDLRGNCLSGKIPSWLGGLTGLQLLGLDENEFDGEIPGALGQLKELHTLYLHSNQLSGNIPSWLGGLDGLTKLQQLRLGDNDFDGGIPANLSQLTELRLLRLNDNNLSGNIPSQLGQLTGLTGLYLYGNQLTGPIPSELGGLSNLEYLWLYRNRLTGPIPAQLGSLTKLWWLSLSYNQLTGPIPSELGELGELGDLQYVYLHRNRLTGPIPTQLGNLTKLRRLYLNCNDLTGTVPTELGNITTLARLGINGNPRLSQDLPAGLNQSLLWPIACPSVVPIDGQGPGAAPGPGPPLGPGPPPGLKRPRLAAALTAAPAPVRVGESVTFTLTVTNPGTVPLSGVFWRSPVLGVARRAVGDGALAVDAAVATTFSFGPVTQAHHPGPIIVAVFADSDQTDDVRARVLVTVQPAAQPDCEDPPAAARSATSTLDLVIVRAFYSTPGAADPNLCHNILDLQLTLPDGTATACDFLTHYETTGGLARWGYATSEILEEAPGALTQYYQRGAVDCHFRAGQWRIERRLTWDFIGGGLGGAPDPGVEPPRSEYPGLFPGPWGLRVSNFAVDGTFTGFRDFFQAHGGVAAFGYPKTEARYDDDPAAVLRLPGSTPGFIRQYFQAAVFEFHPDDPADPVKLGLAGDALRDLRYPNQTHQRFASFRPAPILTSGEGYVAERVVWNPPPP